MTANKHLQTLRDIAFRRTLLDESAYARFAASSQFSWPSIITTMQALRLPDGSSAIASMTYGARLAVGTFGSYTAQTRHIDIAAGEVTERSLATCLHEMAHALLHYDVSIQCYAENESWLEAEADTVADLTLMMMGLAPRRSTQWAFANLGNVGDVAAFFHFAGATCAAAAETIHKAWSKACAAKAKLSLVA